jgi:hypothetical protein
LRVDRRQNRVGLQEIAEIHCNTLIGRRAAGVNVPSGAACSA